MRMSSWRQHVSCLTTLNMVVYDELLLSITYHWYHWLKVQHLCCILQYLSPKKYQFGMVNDWNISPLLNFVAATKPCSVCTPKTLLQCKSADPMLIFHLGLCSVWELTHRLRSEEVLDAMFVTGISILPSFQHRNGPGNHGRILPRWGR